MTAGAAQPGRAALLAALLGACATARPPAAAPVEPPAGARLHGLEFGQGRAAAEAALRAAGVEARADPADEDTLVAARCPGAAGAGACRLLFGPAGLYASEVRARASGEAELGGLLASLSGAWGEPDRDWHPGPGSPVVSHWETGGWTVAVSRDPGAAEALVRCEWDAATPPTVAGVPLGARREAVEALLARRGAVRVDADAQATTFLGCPDGAPEAHTCVVEFHGGRAAAVVEVFPRHDDDREAMAAWRARSAELEREIGKPPAVACPAAGPDRAAGSCTASWAGQRLAVTVGAQRGPGGRHRGAISLWTSWAYPPLLPAAPGPLEPGQAPPEPAAPPAEEAAAAPPEGAGEPAEAGADSPK